MRFSSTSRGALDGFDMLKPGKGKIKVELMMDGEEVAADKIFLGEKLQQPAVVPTFIKL